MIGIIGIWLMAMVALIFSTWNYFRIKRLWERTAYELEAIWRAIHEDTHNRR
jgi:hypothetical protein